MTAQWVLLQPGMLACGCWCCLDGPVALRFFTCWTPLPGWHNRRIHVQTAVAIQEWRASCSLPTCMLVHPCMIALSLHSSCRMLFLQTPAAGAGTGNRTLSRPHPGHSATWPMQRGRLSTLALLLSWMVLCVRVLPCAVVTRTPGRSGRSCCVEGRSLGGDTGSVVFLGRRSAAVLAPCCGHADGAQQCFSVLCPALQSLAGLPLGQLSHLCRGLGDLFQICTLCWRRCS